MGPNVPAHQVHRGTEMTGVDMFPNRILYAADGSPAADRARAAVVDLLRERNAPGSGSPPCEAHVVHVGLLSPWTNPDVMNPGQVERLREEGQAVLDAESARLTEAGITPTAVHLALGRAVDEVLRVRDDIGADLIVLGSRGRNAFVRVLLGSDAQSIVHHAPCSVLVVREDV